jgi:hypothetical protein
MWIWREQIFVYDYHHQHKSKAREMRYKGGMWNVCNVQIEKIIYELTARRTLNSNLMGFFPLI